jgi:N-ethylmaleimide reductase
MSTLFTSYQLATIRLANRVVMAPMTRSRALGNVPNELMSEYYRQRASAGLIITEGTAPSPDGLGYARIPGLYTDAQVAGWERVTAAVHARGGVIFAQLMHTGRIGHPLNMPAGARLLAPSAVRAAGKMYTDQQGMLDHPEPRAMTADDVRGAIDDHARAAGNARRAGFDGVEMHAANGYLLEQFSNPQVNRREDDYGGSIENRARFVLEATGAVAAAIGASRVGIRISPYSLLGDMPPYEHTDVQYLHLVRELRRIGVAYVHIVVTPDPRAAELARRLAREFAGMVILNGGFDGVTAAAAIDAGDAALVSFGRPFIANPDFVERLRAAAPLAAVDPSTLYTPGARGYIDYAALPEPVVLPAPPALRFPHASQQDAMAALNSGATA